jgi:hypothetical protein
MPKFVGRRDFDFINRINKELIQDVIDVTVTLCKIIVEQTKTNLYGEAVDKIRYNGIEIHALISYGEITTTEESRAGPDVKQEVEFRFVRKILEDQNVYPETGDIINYNGNYYDIFNVNEQQLIASREDYNMSVICKTYITRRSGLNIEARQV